MSSSNGQPMLDSRSWPISSPFTWRAQVEGEEPVGVTVRLELVGGDQPGPERGGEVLALGRAEPHLHLAHLQVPG